MKDERAAAILRARMPLIDGMRLVAAFAVVLYHYTATPAARQHLGVAPSSAFPEINTFSRYGWVGVEIFFVISGLVIARSAANRSIRQFAISRFTRLYPAYWASVVLTTAIVWQTARSSPTWSDVALNFTMIQGQLGVPNLQTAYWTLLVELKFYCIIGIMLWRGPISNSNLVRLALVWPLVGIGSDFLLDSTPSTHWTHVIWLSLGGLLVPQFAPYFSLGLLTHCVLAGERGLRLHVAVLTNTVLAALWTYRAAADAQVLQGEFIEPGFAIAIVAAGVLLVAFMARVRVSPLLATALAWAGAVSYPLYLIHGELGYLVIDRSIPAVGLRWSLAIAIAVSIAVAISLHVTVERFLTPTVRGLISPRAPGLPVASATVAEHDEHVLAPDQTEDSSSA